MRGGRYVPPGRRALNRARAQRLVRGILGLPRALWIARRGGDNVARGLADEPAQERRGGGAK